MACSGQTFDQTDQSQQSALTRTRVAGEERHFAGFELKAQVAEGIPALRIAFRDVFEANHFSPPLGSLNDPHLYK